MGLLGKLGYIELATEKDGKTHIGIKDVFNILGDEKDFLCRCNNKVLKSVLTVIDNLVQNGEIEISNVNYTEQTELTSTTDVGTLEPDVQKLYDKYTKVILIPKNTAKSVL